MQGTLKAPAPGGWPGRLGNSRILMGSFWGSSWLWWALARGLRGGCGNKPGTALRHLPPLPQAPSRSQGRVTFRSRTNGKVGHRRTGFAVGGCGSGLPACRQQPHRRGPCAGPGFGGPRLFQGGRCPRAQRDGGRGEALHRLKTHVALPGPAQVGALGGRDTFVSEAAGSSRNSKSLVRHEIRLKRTGVSPTEKHGRLLPLPLKPCTWSGNAGSASGAQYGAGSDSDISAGQVGP